MPTYITLLRWTPKGIENIKESPGRLDAAKKTMEDMGAQFRAFYLVTGKCRSARRGNDDQDQPCACFDRATTGLARLLERQRRREEASSMLAAI